MTDLHMPTVVTLIREMSNSMTDYDYQKSNAEYYRERCESLNKQIRKLEDRVALMEKEIAEYSSASLVE